MDMNPLNKAFDEDGKPKPGVNKFLNHVLRAQRPMVIKDPKLGEVIAIRDMMYLSLTYDHRLIDGAKAALFLSAVKARLEEGDFAGELGA